MSKPAIPELFESANLSLAWAKVLARLAEPGVDSIAPLYLTITGFDDAGVPKEVPELRAAVDELLAAEGKKDVENIAWTIFPQRYLQMAGGDREELFRMFREAFPRVQQFNPRNNKRGSYFQRLVDFEGGNQGFNQLKWIIDEYHRNPKGRRSKWQATTFDPSRDFSTTALLEFPCLQQVSFVPTDEDGLIVNAFYATQQMVHKGYGNYLGLARLGAFMASQMGLKLERLNVFVGIAKMDKIGKTNPNFVKLLAAARSALASAEDIRHAA